ncbi:hypothetical protein IWW37_003917 [Coemansia sp. RSA 2050]|nr:hypothetical protein IWW37_003917 [Coemansia sp. RSA 2050]KAJ2737085.1 hypothetical protein IW152_000348 [Coemansia sp. BCRC 34962]
MDDLEGEAEHCDEDSPISDLVEHQLYPCNFVPFDAREPTAEALLGARDILLIIHIALQAGVIPDARTIRETYEIEKEKLPHVSDFFACGGSILYILDELTKQVEGDMRGEAYHEDTEDLIESLERVPPCALDKDLSHWRRALGI